VDKIAEQCECIVHSESLVVGLRSKLAKSAKPYVYFIKVWVILGQILNWIEAAFLRDRKQKLFKRMEHNPTLRTLLVKYLNEVSSVQ